MLDVDEAIELREFEVERITTWTIEAESEEAALEQIQEEAELREGNDDWTAEGIEEREHRRRQLTMRVRHEHAADRGQQPCVATGHDLLDCDHLEPEERCSNCGDRSVTGLSGRASGMKGYATLESLGVPIGLHAAEVTGSISRVWRLARPHSWRTRFGTLNFGGLKFVGAPSPMNVWIEDRASGAVSYELPPPGEWLPEFEIHWSGAESGAVASQSIAVS